MILTSRVALPHIHYIIKIMRHRLVSAVHSKLGRDKSPILLESKEDEEWRTVSLI